MSSGAEWLRTPAAVRARCAEILDVAEAGGLEGFELRLNALDEVADRVAASTRARYPDLEIPYHGRAGHFRYDGDDRWAALGAELEPLGERERGRRLVELVITSVLLDAGAGPRWRYLEAGRTHARSEGLAVASLHAFRAGLFSSEREDPLRVDGSALETFEASTLGSAFQVEPANPLVGVDGRAELLRALGRAVTTQPEIFGAEGRLGGICDHLIGRAEEGRLPAKRILEAVLVGLGPIWPARVEIDGVLLGDVGRHPAAGADAHDVTRGWVPFHKLSQWLSYSLLEPLEACGLEVTDLDALTGLAEYRNGGLFVDAGVLVPRNARVFERAHPPSSALIVEWRALTVALLDRLAPRVRERLGVAASSFPLVKMLEGGTWHAGREIARARRADGSPPLRLDSDGTVF